MVKKVLGGFYMGLLGLGLALGTGCSFGSEDSDTGVTAAVDQQTSVPAPTRAQDEPPPANTPPANNTDVPDGFGDTSAPVATDGRDQLDFSGAILLGPHKGVPVKSARITRNLFAASIEGSNVRFSVQDLGWPVPGTPVDGVNARTFIFWREGGQLYGGMFEWQRPGQTVKTLKNIPNGYLDGRKPPRGAQVWFMISNIAANERTNVVLCQNPWQ